MIIGQGFLVVWPLIILTGSSFASAQTHTEGETWKMEILLAINASAVLVPSPH